MTNTRVAVLMESDKEMPKMQSCADATDPSIVDRLSGHREPWAA